MIGDLVGHLPGCIFDSRANGVTFGTTGSLQYPVLVSSDEVTCICEFYPTWLPGDTVHRNLWYNTNVALRCWHIQDGRFRFYMYDDVAFSDVAKADYESLWRINQRNQIVVAFKTGDTDIYFNGVHVKNFTTSYTTKLETNVYLGGSSIAADSAEAKITQFHIHDRKWTAQEAKDWWNNKAFDYREKAEAYLPMREKDHITSLLMVPLYTRDRSKNRHNLYFATAPYCPTKLADTRGYEFNGNDIAAFDYYEYVGEYTDNFTISLLARWNTLGSNAGAVTKTADGETTGFIIFKDSNDKPTFNSGGGSPAQADYAVCNSQWTHIVVVIDSGTAYMYIDGIKQGTSGTANITLGMDPIVLGAYYTDSSANQLNGAIAHFSIYPEVLTPTQIKLEHRRLMETLNVSD